MNFRHRLTVPRHRHRGMFSSLRRHRSCLKLTSAQRRDGHNFFFFKTRQGCSCAWLLAAAAFAVVVVVAASAAAAAAAAAALQLCPPLTIPLSLYQQSRGEAALLVVFKQTKHEVEGGKR